MGRPQANECAGMPSADRVGWPIFAFLSGSGQDPKSEQGQTATYEPKDQGLGT